MKIWKLCAVLAFSASYAVAGDSDVFLPEITKPPRPVKNFLEADLNRNGQVTKEEFMAQRARWAQKRGSPHNEKQSEQIFLNKDRNKNGEITPEEYRLR